MRIGTNAILQLTIKSDLPPWSTNTDATLDDMVEHRCIILNKINTMYQAPKHASALFQIFASENVIFRHQARLINKIIFQKCICIRIHSASDELA